jgi:hypothetical protein
MIESDIGEKLRKRKAAHNAVVISEMSEYSIKHPVGYCGIPDFSDFFNHGSNEKKGNKKDKDDPAYR